MILLFFALTILISGCVTIFCIDDLFIDFIALFKNLKPIKISKKDLQGLHGLSQKKIAIMIANWHEEEILERMIAGNAQSIDYTNYEFFLGVYPNDQATLEVALKIKQSYQNVNVIINSEDGPTSKGQMLNQIVNFIRQKEIETRAIYDVLMLHDSEDIIHPLSLKLINSKMIENDFVQIPVFSLPTSVFELTRCTYIDEFTESHTKDMLVRSYFKAGVPSAGVGTAMSRLFVAEMLSLQNNQLMKEDTLTEDYHLGIMAHRLGYRSEFVSYYTHINNQIDHIATREYFPSRIETSVRQKTRWTLGISLQGYDNLKWGKTLSENYFLWRDRRGLINSPLLIVNYFLFVCLVSFYFVNKTWPNFVLQSDSIQALFVFNFFCMCTKIIQRLRLVGALNGYRFTLLIPVRWLLANYINSMASIHAFRTYRSSQRKGIKPKWVKTVHELPIGFGLAPTRQAPQLQEVVS